MATPSSSPALLKRGQATRGHHHHHATGDGSPRRGRRGSAVHFDEITSIYPVDTPQQDVGTLRSDAEEDDDQGGAERCYAYSTLLQKRSVKKFFRVCAVFNLLSLAFSAPLRVCSEAANGGNGTDASGEDCQGVFVQFVVIAGADLVLALLYTVQLFMRVQYTVFLCCRKGNRKVKEEGESEGGREE